MASNTINHIKRLTRCQKHLATNTAPNDPAHTARGVHCTHCHQLRLCDRQTDWQKDTADNSQHFTHSMQPKMYTTLSNIQTYRHVLTDCQKQSLLIAGTDLTTHRVLTVCLSQCPNYETFVCSFLLPDQSQLNSADRSEVHRRVHKHISKKTVYETSCWLISNSHVQHLFKKTSCFITHTKLYCDDYRMCHCAHSRTVKVYFRDLCEAVIPLKINYNTILQQSKLVHQKLMSYLAAVLSAASASQMFFLSVCFSCVRSSTFFLSCLMSRLRNSVVLSSELCYKTHTNYVKPIID